MTLQRRRFITRSVALSAAASLPRLGRAQAPQRLRLAMIGTGLRGQVLLRELLRRDDVDVVALCDIEPIMLNRALAQLDQAGRPRPFTCGEDRDDFAYRRLLDRPELDGVIIATPWEWHAPMIIGSLEAGVKYVGSEVILGITLQDHWDVIHAAERHKGHVMMLENVCYRRDVMAILNMVRQGMFGELMHLQAGYQHDLRAVKFNNGQQPYGGGVEFGDTGFSEAAWRTNHSVHRNGDLYPTHGIGPVAEMLNINYGNRFVSLSSFATKARGLHEYVMKNGGESHPNAKVEFKLGDVVTTMINCVNGETILLQHDTNLPRPYSLGFRVQGTKGIWMDVNKSLYLEGTSQKEHSWEEAKPYLEKYDHPLWQRWTKEADGAGHGGMDFFVVHAFIESIKNDKPTPIDVYDSAAWSAITPLSEQSIELGNETVQFPDFTSGQWMYRKTRFALDDTY